MVRRELCRTCAAARDRVCCRGAVAVRLSLVCVKVQSRPAIVRCAAAPLPCLILVSSLTNALAKSLTVSCLLCQTLFGDGPDKCLVSRAFCCMVQLRGYFFAMFLC